MVAHWRKKRGPHWVKSAFVNGLGGFVTGITVLVILVAKFVEGAWITILFIPMLILIFSAVRRHYHSVTTITLYAVQMVDPVDRLWSALRHRSRAHPHLDPLVEQRRACVRDRDEAAAHDGPRHAVPPSAGGEPRRGTDAGQPPSRPLRGRIFGAASTT